jgi:hypothetical protein
MDPLQSFLPSDAQNLDFTHGMKLPSRPDLGKPSVPERQKVERALRFGRFSATVSQ